MSDGTIPESAAYVLGGIVVLVILAGIVLGVITQISNLRAKSISEKNATLVKAEEDIRRIRSEAAIAVEVARAEATKEVASKIAFEQLTIAVNKMDESVSKLSKGVGDQIEGIKKDQESLCRRVDRIADSTRSAHKRMDEHRKVDHSFPNGHYVEPDEDAEEEIKL